MSQESTGRQHATSSPPTATPPAPEPSFAERAKTLVALEQQGTLATLSSKHPGWPFSSMMPYSLDAHSRPSFLISTMAVHTQNLVADARASLLITQSADQSAGNSDPLARARVTLMGEVAPVPEAERAATRAAYLAIHDNAAVWVDFDDFALYRLTVTDVYYVGGFGAMGWVTAQDYIQAEPDPLATAAAGIIAHMNQDHADALQLYCRAFADIEADEAVMLSVDRLGFRVRVRTGERMRGIRLAFSREVRTAQDARTVLVEMVREAREKV